MKYIQPVYLLIASLINVLLVPNAFGNDPYDAWEAGQYDEALQGFLDQQMENPNNRSLGMNVGSAHYMLGDFEKAAAQFDLLTQKGTPTERSEAFYNLGNTKYRQGKLDEALEAYQKTVELNPEDKDANYNLEFVRDEIRRRHEEAQKNQEQNPNQNQQNQQREQNGEQSQDGEQQDQQDPQNSMSDDPEHPRESEEPDAPQNANPDQDGATDQPEGNPEPQPGDESKPEEQGQEGSAAQEQEGEQPQQEQGQAQDGASNPDGGQNGQERALTPEEAQRYLDALDPDRPPTQKRARKGRRSRKDW